MVLEADTLIDRSRQKPKKRPAAASKLISKDVLLLGQRVKKKRGPRALTLTSPGPRRKRANPLEGLRSLRRKIVPSPVLPKGLSRLLPSGTNLFLSILAVSAVAMLLYLAVSQYAADGVSETVSLPEDSSARVHLLHYIAPESGAKGSGEVGIPDGRIIDTVKTFSYTIRRGETLSEIAAKHDLDVGTLISFNDIEDVRRVMAGTELTVPDVDGVPYTVKKGDTLERIAGRYNVRLENILDANDLQSATIQPGENLFIPGGEISEYQFKKAMGTLFVYPTGGRLTSGYGYRIDPFTGIRRMHYGIDLADSVGTTIKATMEGRVAAVGNQPRGYGKYVVIQHNHGFQSLYGHLSTIDVRRGEYIGQGHKVGEMGNSGRSTGPHLHFALYKNNVPVNPLNGYLYQ